jgi:hypothetical protein
MEFPAITLVIFCLLKSGRRITLMIFYTLGGIRHIQKISRNKIITWDVFQILKILY